LGHVALDLLHDPALRSGQLVRQLQLRRQFSGAREGRRSMPPLRLTEQQERELVGEDLVVREPLARDVRGGLTMRQRQ
jgi:hypothetical protein